MRKNTKEWTPKELALLKRWVADKIPATEIARRLGRTKSAIDSRKHIMGLTADVQWTPEEEQCLKKLVAEGLKVKDIAKILKNRSVRAIHCRKDKLELLRLRKLSARDPRCVAALIKFRMAGWKINQIAKVYGADKAEISYVLCQNGFKGKWWVRGKHKKPRPRWSELEVTLLRKYLRKEYTFQQICSEFRYRSPSSIRSKITRITRYWLSPEELSERAEMAARYRRQMRVY